MNIIILTAHHLTLSIYLAQHQKALVSGVYQPKALQDQPFEKAQLVAFLPKRGTVMQTLDGVEKVIAKAPTGYALEHQYLMSAKRYLKKPYYWHQIEQSTQSKCGNWMVQLIIAASFVLGSKSRYHLQNGSRVKFWNAKSALGLAQHARKSSMDLGGPLQYQQDAWMRLQKSTSSNSSNS